MGLLGDFLEAVCGSVDRFRTVRAVIHHWQDRGASERALVAGHTVGRRREPRAEPGATAIWESTLRVWAGAPNRARVEETRRRDGIVESSLAVVNESRWWHRDHQGHVQEGTSGERGPRPGPPLTSLERHFSPALVREALAGLALEANGTVRTAGRECLRVRAVRRAAGRLWPHWLGFGADEYELHVDPVRGAVLFVGSSFRGEVLETNQVTEVTFDEPLPDDLFTYEPRQGEQVRPAEPIMEPLTLAAAVTRVPFTVLVPRCVPESHRDRGFEVMYHPPRVNDSRPRLTVMYIGPGTLILNQSNTPPGHDGYEWESVERGGRRVEISDPGSGAGARLVRLEHLGTYVEIHSALGRDPLLELALSLEPATGGMT